MDRRQFTDDYYTKRARSEGLRARSYFKLEAIDRRFHLIRPGQRLIDLGAAPGSWSIYCVRRTRGNITIQGIDLQQIEPLPDGRCRFLQQDVFLVDPGDLEQLVDGVLSDLAPRTTGIKAVDADASAELVLRAAEIAQKLLKPGGFFVAKFLEGGDVGALLKTLKNIFPSVKRFTPEPTRRGSAETFFIAA